MPAQQELKKSADTFEGDLRRVLTDVRSAVGQLINLLPGSPSRANDIGKVLNIDRNLAWKMSRVISEPDAFGAAGYIPGTSGMNIVLKAASRHNVPKDAVESVRAAADRYEKLIATHAGDRASLQLLLSGQSRKGRRQAETTHSRAAFRANSFMLGIQARTSLRADFISAGADGTFDVGSVASLIDLRRIRPDAPYVIQQPRCSGDDGIYRSARTEPMDPDAATSGVLTLLPDFSSHPTPTFHRLAVSDERVEYQLDSGPVGKAGAITCTRGEIGRSIRDLIGGPHAGVGALIRTPCEVFIFDNYVHEDLCDSNRHEADYYSDIYGTLNAEGPSHEAHRLPYDLEVEYLGRGSSVVMTPDVPRYPELADYVFQRLGWEADRFKVYRVRIQFPFVPSSVFMRHG